MDSLAHSAAASGARYTLNAKGSELLEPLLKSTTEENESDDSSEENGEEQDRAEEVEKQSLLERLKSMLVYGILGTGVAFSALAFVLAPLPLVFIAGSICLANVPYSAYKEYHLSKIPTLRSLNNALKMVANQLQDGVENLSSEIDILVPEAERANAVEEELRQIADRQHCNVDKLVNLVKENGEIIAAMKANLRQRVVQDIIKIVVSCDKDRDSRFNKVETKMLALRIRIQLQEYGVDFDEARFFAILRANPTVTGIINIVLMLSPHYDVILPSQDGSMDDENEAGDDKSNVSEIFRFQSKEGLDGPGESLMETRRERKSYYGKKNEKDSDDIHH